MAPVPRRLAFIDRARDRVYFPVDPPLLADLPVESEDTEDTTEEGMFSRSIGELGGLADAEQFCVDFNSRLSEENKPAVANAEQATKEAEREEAEARKQDESRGAKFLLPSEFAKAILAKSLPEEILYLVAGGARHFEEKIVGYKPTKKIEPWNGIPPYPFAHIDPENIKSNLEEMRGEGPAEIFVLGGGRLFKEKIIYDALKEIYGDIIKIHNIEISPEYARLAELNLPDVHTVMANFMDESDGGILNAHVFESIFGRPNGLRRIFTNLGGFFGNPPLKDSINFVRRVGRLMQPGDEFLLGFDGTTDNDLLEKIYSFQTETGSDPLEDWGARPVIYGLTKLLKFAEKSVSRRDLHRVTTVTRDEGGHHVVELKLDTSQHPKLQFQALPPLLEKDMRKIQAEFRNLSQRYLVSRRTPIDLARTLFFNECALQVARRKPGFEDQPFRAPDDNPYVKMGIDSFICRLIRT